MARRRRGQKAATAARHPYGRDKALRRAHKQNDTDMGVKAYFKGKSGGFFWANILLMAVVLVGTPLIVLWALGAYTHHGEKIEVPSVVGKSSYDAENLLDDRGLVAIVADSAYRASAAPGTVLEQTPKAGSEVKSGRVVYLTVNLNGEPLTKFPDLVGNSSLREAEAKLKALGFKLAPYKYVDNEPKDFVIRIKQGMRDVQAGEMVSRDRALTLYVGAGEAEDTLVNDTGIIEREETPADFDIEL